MNTGTMLAGRYRLEEQLGMGGMGTVWRAFDTSLERTVGVKLLRPDIATDVDARARFEREARAVAALSGPGIVRVHDVGADSAATGTPVPFIVMELLEGQTLAAVLTQRGPLPVPEALRLVTAVADALRVAHDSGVVHRDIKPGNLMLDDTGHVTIMDFGIAAVRGQTGLTATNMVMGTVAYAAPEQLAGETSHASDLYSLGVVLRECLTGSADTADTIPATVPPDVMALVTRATARDPQERFASAAEFASACRGVVAMPPTLVAPVPPAIDGAPAKVPSRLIGPIIAGVLTLLIVLTTGAGAVAYATAPTDRGAPPLSGDEQKVLKAAEIVVTAMFSYDYRTFDDSVESGAGHTVEPHTTKYREKMNHIKDTAVAKKTVVKTEVASSGIVDDSRKCDAHDQYSECVTALVFIDQTTTSKNVTAPTNNGSRLSLTMVLTDGGWKAAESKAL